MPLALAVGLGTLTVPDALGLLPVPQSRVVLVDARDTDPAEHVLLEDSAVTRRPVSGMDDADLPEGELYLHIDLDVCDPADVPDLLYPAPGGPRLAHVLEAIERIAATGRVAAVGIGATWRQGSPAASEQRSALSLVATAALRAQVPSTGD